MPLGSKDAAAAATATIDRAGDDGAIEASPGNDRSAATRPAHSGLPGPTELPWLSVPGMGPVVRIESI